MAENECEIILQLYPEMVLISRQPFAWKGFLNCRSDFGRSVRVKMKLIVPRYPALDGATVYFGERIGWVTGGNFTRMVENLVTDSKNLLSLLKQLEVLIVNKTSTITTADWEDDRTNLTEHRPLDMVEELRDAFNFERMETASRVRLLTDSNFNSIKLAMNGVSLKLRKTRLRDSRWTVVSSDLPQIPEFGPFERNLANLHAARSKFRLQVQIFEESWRKLREIDRNCWVLDPAEPKSSHLYRRIYLTDSLSVLIKLHPLHPKDMPEIKFLGRDNDIREREDIVSRNAYKWDPESSLLDNLRVLLDVSVFPQNGRGETEEDRIGAATAAMIADTECCICFSLELNQEKLPNVICNNLRCRKHFHAACLIQFLQTVAGNYFFFGHVHGLCPHCGETISCPV